VIASSITSEADGTNASDVEISMFWKKEESRDSNSSFSSISSFSNCSSILVLNSET